MTHEEEVEEEEEEVEQVEEEVEEEEEEEEADAEQTSVAEDCSEGGIDPWGEPSWRACEEDLVLLCLCVLCLWW